MITDKQTALFLLRPKHTILDCLSDELRNNRDIVTTAITYCSEKDIDLASAVPVKFRDDEKIVKLMLEYDPSAFKYASDRLKKDRDMVMHAVTVWGPSLQHASPELQDDREIVLTAVSQNGLSLEYASDRLKADKDVAIAAIRNYYVALRYIPESLQTDSDVTRVYIECKGPFGRQT